MHEVTLKAPEPEDLDFMLEVENERDVAIWTDYCAPFSRHQLLDYILSYDADPFRAGQLRLIIRTQEGQRAGILDLYNISQKDSKAYIGICMHPSFRKKGMATAALEALIAFNESKLGIETLVAKVSAENPVALRLFKKVGFMDIALLPRWHRIGKRSHDFHLLMK